MTSWRLERGLTKSLTDYRNLEIIKIEPAILPNLYQGHCSTRNLHCIHIDEAAENELVPSYGLRTGSDSTDLKITPAGNRSDGRTSCASASLRHGPPRSKFVNPGPPKTVAVLVVLKSAVSHGRL